MNRITIKERELLLSIEKHPMPAVELSAKGADLIVDCKVDYERHGWTRQVLSCLWAKNWIEVRDGKLRVCRDIAQCVAGRGAK